MVIANVVSQPRMFNGRPFVRVSMIFGLFEASMSSSSTGGAIVG